MLIRDIRENTVRIREYFKMVEKLTEAQDTTLPWEKTNESRTEAQSLPEKQLCEEKNCDQNTTT